jgi:hypothetical protein
MKQSGFTHIGTEGGIGILRGHFAPYKNCNIGAAAIDHAEIEH